MSCEKEISYTGDMIDYLGKLSEKHDPYLSRGLQYLAEQLDKAIPKENHTGVDFEVETGENIPNPEASK